MVSRSFIKLKVFLLCAFPGDSATPGSFDPGVPERFMDVCKGLRKLLLLLPFRAWETVFQLDFNKTPNLAELVKELWCSTYLARSNAGF